MGKIGGYTRIQGHHLFERRIAADVGVGKTST
jgi:hypothetical protein